ncbi:hypothetical protein [Stutzerimonas nosocomialis]|uniref:hypothetical protein n=1 Tax=Stutzerimonas nosocomialis TaxID=1056496 RepID=UPI001107C2D3|nr:hypothetical protein [Stutzerimonas nosocomialis]
MGSAIIFAAFVVVALLMPLLLAVLIIKFTKTKRPAGYYRSHMFLASGALVVAIAIHHLFSQIIYGEIYFMPRGASTAFIASIENEPVQFALLSALYIAFCGLLTILLFKAHRALQKHLAKGPN